VYRQALEDENAQAQEFASLPEETLPRAQKPLMTVNNANLRCKASPSLLAAPSARVQLKGEEKATSERGAGSSLDHNDEGPERAARSDSDSLNGRARQVLERCPRGSMGADSMDDLITALTGELTSSEVCGQEAKSMSGSTESSGCHTRNDGGGAPVMHVPDSIPGHVEAGALDETVSKGVYFAEHTLSDGRSADICDDLSDALFDDLSPEEVFHGCTEAGDQPRSLLSTVFDKGGESAALRCLVGGRSDSSTPEAAAALHGADASLDGTLDKGAVGRPPRARMVVGSQEVEPSHETRVQGQSRQSRRRSRLPVAVDEHADVEPHAVFAAAMGAQRSTITTVCQRSGECSASPSQVRQSSVSQPEDVMSSGAELRVDKPISCPGLAQVEQLSAATGSRKLAAPSTAPMQRADSIYNDINSAGAETGAVQVRSNSAPPAQDDDLGIDVASDCSADSLENSLVEDLDLPDKKINKSGEPLQVCLASPCSEATTPHGVQGLGQLARSSTKRFPPMSGDQCEDDLSTATAGARCVDGSLTRVAQPPTVDRVGGERGAWRQGPATVQGPEVASARVPPVKLLRTENSEDTDAFSPEERRWHWYSLDSSSSRVSVPAVVEDTFCIATEGHRIDGPRQPNRQDPVDNVRGPAVEGTDGSVGGKRQSPHGDIDIGSRTKRKKQQWFDRMYGGASGGVAAGAVQRERPARCKFDAGEAARGRGRGPIMAGRGAGRLTTQDGGKVLSSLVPWPSFETLELGRGPAKGGAPSTIVLHTELPLVDTVLPPWPLPGAQTSGLFH